MIAFLSGKIMFANDEMCILNVNGVGYEIFIKDAIFLDKKEKVGIYIYQHVREDINILYGFKTIEERELYIKLLSVKGIGPKAAMSIIKFSDIKTIYQSLEKDDISFFKSIPGIGKKAASQIILDLKGKLKKEENISNIDNSRVKDALISLGYKKNEIYKTLKEINLNGKKDEEIIKEFLIKCSQ